MRVRRAPPSARRTRIPPILKARFPGPGRLGRRENEVMSPRPDPVASGGDSRVRVISQGGPRPAEGLSTGRDTEARQLAPGPRAQRGQESVPRPGRRLRRLQSPQKRFLAGPFQIIASLCPPPSGCFKPYALFPSITRCPWSLAFCWKDCKPNY